MLIFMLQASRVLPLMRTAHDPQMAAWHEQRMPIEPSCFARACRIPSSTDMCSGRSTPKPSQRGASPVSGS